MGDARHKEFATDLLATIGLRVDSVPCGSDRSADLIASDENSRYLIELKEKLDQHTEPEISQFSRGEVVTRSVPTTYNNRISAILRDGRDQLNESAKSLAAFRLVWFHASGFDADLRHKQAFNTFYGRVHLLPIFPAGGEITQCFYFDYSEAWSMPTVDAMILTDGAGLQLCLNEFSARHREFRSSSLCHLLAQGLVDPRELERQGQILAFRQRCSRTEEAEILRALAEETGVKYSVIRFAQHSAAVAVPVRMNQLAKPETN